MLLFQCLKSNFMDNLAQEFSYRLDQLLMDGKGEVHSFELTCEEFKNKIAMVNLNPLRYYFIDNSDITFKDNNIYFNL